jgi:hypothetical protein
LFSLKAAGDSMHYTWQLWVGLLMLIGADIWMHGKRFDLFIQQKHIAVRWATYAVLLLALTVLASGEEQPFIYFQF